MSRIIELQFNIGTDAKPFTFQFCQNHIYNFDQPTVSEFDKELKVVQGLYKSKSITYREYDTIAHRVLKKVLNYITESGNCKLVKKPA